MSNFVHKDIEITLSEGGHFVAFINGKRTVAASVAAMKKKIDTATAFEPFDGLIFDRDLEEPILQVRVIGVQKPSGRASWNNCATWLIDGRKNESKVYPLSAKAAMESYLTTTAESRSLKAERQTLDDEAREAIGKELRPD